MSTTAATLDEPRDLGFGEKVAQQARARLLNRDGSFNVSRFPQAFFFSVQTLATIGYGAAICYATRGDERERLHRSEPRRPHQARSRQAFQGAS